MTCRAHSRSCLFNLPTIFFLESIVVDTVTNCFAATDSGGAGGGDAINRRQFFGRDESRRLAMQPAPALAKAVELEHKLDPYGGVIIDGTKLPNVPAVFEESLRRTCTKDSRFLSVCCCCF
jgi:hypothetical protein